jgi:hypothetical protein
MQQVAKMLNNKILSRIIAIALFAAVVGGTWDAWWHGAIGRDSLFEPPHLLLYSSVILAISIGLFGWRKTREKVWKRLALVLLLVPLSAPFDELWHRIFGIEDLASPLIVWSPPHLAIIFAMLTSIVILLPIIKKDTKDMQIVLGGMLFAAMLSLLLFLVSPFVPEGPWHLVGFLGAGIVALILSFILLTAERWIPIKGGATITGAFFISLSAIGFNEIFAEGVTIVPHAHAPSFLIVFSLLLAAGVVSFLSDKNNILAGAIAGFVWAAMVYGFSWLFFAPEFVYTLIQGIIAIIASVIGGAIGAIGASKILKKELKH